MKTFKAFKLNNADLVYGGDLIVTWANDIYDTDRGEIIIFDLEN